MALDTRVLTMESAEEYVRRSRNVRWDGWDLVKFVPNKNAWKMPNGVYNRETGEWGLEYRTPVDSRGLWTIKVPVSRK